MKSVNDSVNAKTAVDAVAAARQQSGGTTESKSNGSIQKPATGGNGGKSGGGACNDDPHQGDFNDKGEINFCRGTDNQWGTVC